MKAGGDLNLTGTQVSIGTNGAGTGLLQATGAINIAAVTDEVKTSLFNDPKSKQYDRQVHQNQTVGAGVASTGDLTAEEALTLNAGRDLLVTTVASEGSEKHTHEEKRSGFSFGAGGMGYSKSQQKQASDDTVT